MFSVPYSVAATFGVTHDLGWPTNVVRWVGCFMEQRSARIRLEDTTTSTTPLTCGLPQGSPASPILFLLYTAPIYSLGEPNSRFGYADDVATLICGRSLQETVALATRAASELIQWGADNGVVFDSDKTEVIHFTRPRYEGDLPSVWHGPVEKKPQRDLRWLGVWFDRKLSFRTHVEKWAAKAKKVAEFLQSLSNTRRGIPPQSTRHAVTACVLPILLYGAHVWHPGTLRPVWGSCRLIPPRITYLKNRIQQTLNVAMRAIAPVWRTTPIAALHRETGIPPAELLLTDALRRAAVRLRSLDARHPLTPRMSILPTPGRQLMQEYGIRPPRAARKQQASRLLRLHQMTAQAPRPRLQAPAPPQPDPTGDVDKTQAARSFREWLRVCPEDTLIVYTDGSQSMDGACGYGYSLWLGPDEVVYGSGRMPLAEVYDAEVEGALEGLRAALAWSPMTPDRQRPIVVCLDNTAAIRAIRGGPSISSQAVAVTFAEIAARHGDVSTRWCPGHAGIIGNERADRLAKEGCRINGPDRPPTYAFIKRQAKAAARRDFQEWWAAAAPSSYKSLGLKALLGCPPELHTKRQHLHRLLAARSGHGDFADYHERFDHQEARVTCSCGRKKSPTHLFYCRKVSTRYRLRLAPTADKAISQALGRDFSRFLGLATSAEFFDRICHRH
ncbi:hypothetical protein CDD83_8407 [Cordyceps sp. RAO-2017]|nr:hypothetical protein CDD83_8407 [Cordyceps sp. RAO-2017]